MIRYWCAPFGKSLGIKHTRTKKAVPNDILEKAYISKKIKHKQVSVSIENPLIFVEIRHNKYFKSMNIQFKIIALAKQLDWSQRQVERWLRLRCSQDKPSTLKKFCENW